jgi:hypothetical protein
MRLATATGPLSELSELIDTSRWLLDHLDDVPDARPRLMRATEAALPLIHSLVDAAEDDAEAALYEELAADEDEAATP